MGSKLSLGACLQRVDNYEYELPSDFEDEEIDEEAAFTEEDKKQFADWFGDKGAAGTLAANPRKLCIQHASTSVEQKQHLSKGLFADAAASSDADEADLLNSESEHSEDEELNPDDFSEDVSLIIISHPNSTQIFYVRLCVACLDVSSLTLVLQCMASIGCSFIHSTCVSESCAKSTGLFVCR